MATQQEKIREMANKKLLSGEQKKVLYKLFEVKINQEIDRVKTVFHKAEQDLVDRVFREAEDNPTIKKLRATIKQCEIDSAKAEKEINKLGFSLNYHKDSLDTTLNNKEVSKLEKANSKKLSKMEEFKLKLLADIYDLPMSYDEMTSYIEGELAKWESREEKF